MMVIMLINLISKRDKNTYILCTFMNIMITIIIYIHLLIYLLLYLFMFSPKCYTGYNKQVLTKKLQTFNAMEEARDNTG